MTALETFRAALEREAPALRSHPVTANLLAEAMAARCDPSLAEEFAALLADALRDAFCTSGPLSTEALARLRALAGD